MTFRNPLIIWDAESQKWSDPGNDFWCYRSLSGEGWTVSSRYGFAENSKSSEQQEYPNEQTAMEFFVNYLHQRRERLTVEGYERRIGALIRRAATGQVTV